MRLLVNRKFAVLITVAVAVLATLFGVYRTSARYTRKIEALFYDGVYLRDEGYTQPGIEAHLENSANAALGFAAFMDKYPEFAPQAEELIFARRELLAAKGIGEKSAAYLEMSRLFYALFFKQLDAYLPGRDVDAARRYYDTFYGAATAIFNSGYNDEVREYLDGRSFLMRFAGAFAPVREPEYFIITQAATG